jgi:hypothetical protein
MEEDRLKSEIQNACQGTFFASFCHGDYRTSPIVFILSEHVAMYDNMPYG